MKRSWGDFHVEPLDEFEDDDDDKTPHLRAIWRGIDLTTMHNDEVHGVKDGYKQSRPTERTTAGA